jgi:hypothetical protein
LSLGRDAEAIIDKLIAALGESRRLLAARSLDFYALAGWSEVTTELSPASLG